MAYGPTTSWKIDGEKVKSGADFILGGSKITEDSNYSHKIKRCLFLGRKLITNLDSVLKNKDKCPYSQSYGFSSSHVQM